MKKLILPILLGMLLLTGCDKLKEKKLSTIIYQEFEITADGTNTTFSFDSVRTTLDNADLEQVKESIKSYSIKSIKYKPWEVYTDEIGEQILLNGVLGFGNGDSSTPQIEIPLDNLDLTSLTNEAHQILSLSQSDLNKLADYLLSGNELKIYFNGELSTAPAHTMFQFVIETEAVAEVKK